MNNLVLITSVICTPNTPLSYISVRSVYSHEERFEQTKRTIESVKQKIPNLKILIVECSNLSFDQEDYLKKNSDYFLNLYNDEKISNNSIFTSSEMIRFINESLECVVMLNKKYGVNYKVHLKHKRKITKDHSSHYSKFISKKISNKDISIVSPNQNLYDLISNSRLVIGFPFTSPVIIGQELNKPSVFYCSSKLLKPQYKDQNNLFLNTKDSLFSYMEKMLVKTK